MFSFFPSSHPSCNHECTREKSLFEGKSKFNSPSTDAALPMRIHPLPCSYFHSQPSLPRNVSFSHLSTPFLPSLPHASLRLPTPPLSVVVIPNCPSLNMLPCNHLQRRNLCSAVTYDCLNRVVVLLTGLLVFPSTTDTVVIVPLLCTLENVHKSLSFCHGFLRWHVHFADMLCFPACGCQAVVLSLNAFLDIHV